MSEAKAREPLPETGRRITKGTSGDGKPIEFVTGLAQSEISSINPDDLIAPMAINKASIAGKIAHTVLSPATAPLVNAP